MKNLIIIIGTVLLGCYIFGMMVTDEHSLYKASQTYMAEAMTSIEAG